MKKARVFSAHFKDEVLDIYLKEIESYPLIDHQEEKRLARRIRKKDQSAFEKLIRSNLRFVITVAKRYQNRGLNLTDLIAEGNVGLIKAALRYDETKGIRFISYAVWWIRQSILQALAEQSRIFRVPINRADALHRNQKNLELHDTGPGERTDTQRDLEGNGDHAGRGRQAPLYSQNTAVTGQSALYGR